MNKELTPSVAFASLAVWNELKFSLNVIPCAALLLSPTLFVY